MSHGRSARTYCSAWAHRRQAYVRAMATHWTSRNPVEATARRATARDTAEPMRFMRKFSHICICFRVNAGRECALSSLKFNFRNLSSCPNARMVLQWQHGVTAWVHRA